MQVYLVLHMYMDYCNLTTVEGIQKLYNPIVFSFLDGFQDLMCKLQDKKCQNISKEYKLLLINLDNNNLTVIYLQALQSCKHYFQVMLLRTSVVPFLPFLSL